MQPHFRVSRKRSVTPPDPAMLPMRRVRPHISRYESTSSEAEETCSPTSIYEGVSFVSKSPLSVTYTVEGKSTIPSDGLSHKVSVVQLPFEALITVVTVLRQQVLAYLQCEVKNTTDYHLLPGPVSVLINEE